MNEEEIYNGIPRDTRPEEEKDQDWKTDQFASASSPIGWTKKDKFRFFSKRNQLSSLSCMAQSGIKVASIDNTLETGTFIDFSAMNLYRHRFNFPTGGMTLFDTLSLLTKKGIIFKESDLPSQEMTESEMNTKTIVTTSEMLQDSELFRESGYVQFPIRLSIEGKVIHSVDIDEIAKIIDQGKAVQGMFYFMGSEYWKNKPEVTDHSLLAYGDNTSRHGVAFVDYTLDENGERCLVIEDSAGNNTSMKDEHGNFTGQRLITESFLEERCFGAGYLIDRQNALENALVLIATLRKGSKGSQVKILQEILNRKQDAKLITDGIFGQNTSKAVMIFQENNHLVVDGIVGKNTRLSLNK